MSLRYLLRSALLLMTALACAGLAHADTYRIKDMQVTRAQARPTMPAQTTGAAYLTLENQGNVGDRLVGASTPIAASVEVHTMSMEGNMMRMREVGSIDMPPGQKIDMRPGEGLHLMLMGVRQPLKQGERFPLTLEFEKAGKAEITVEVGPVQSTPGHHGHH